jgi:hypothetical protein
MRVRSQPPCQPHSDQLRFRIAIGSLQVCAMPAFEDTSPMVRPPARARRRSPARTRYPKGERDVPKTTVNLLADGAHAVNSSVKATTFRQRPVHAGSSPQCVAWRFRS